jgi:hypothetical protein
MPLADYLHKVSSLEFALWIAYQSIQPLDDPWLRHAREVAFDYNIHSTKHDWQTSDFYPGHKEHNDNTQSLEAMKAILMSGVFTT